MGLCLPCFSSSASAVAADARPPTKKRLSTSLRDDFPPTNTGRESNVKKEAQDDDDDASPTTSTNSAQPRPSKSMVIGTIFGSRRGHVWFCVQHGRLAVKPLLLIEFPIPTHQLVGEMRYGVVRIALECARPDPGSAPVWAVSINGRRQLGFAAKRRAGERIRAILRTMQSTTVGAGVIPGGEGEEEVMYMRANYEHVVGNGASESFHLVSPEQCPSQELSVFLLPSSGKAAGVSRW